MAGYVFEPPNLIKQLGRIADAISVSGAVLGRLRLFCRRYRAAYVAAAEGQPLPDDAPAMRPFPYLALVVLLTVLLVPLTRLILGLMPAPAGVAIAEKIVGSGVAVVHLGQLTGIQPLDGFIGECVRFASYAMLACLFRAFGGKMFDISWIAGFFAYVVGAFEAVQLIGVFAATVIAVTDPSLGGSLSFAVGSLALAGTLLYALVGPARAWPGALELTRRQVIRVTILAAITWAVFHAILRMGLLTQDVLLLGFGI